MSTQEKPKQMMWWQKKIAELEAENELLKTRPIVMDGSTIEVSGMIRDVTKVDAYTLFLSDGREAQASGSLIAGVNQANTNPFATLPTFAKALVLNEWQRIDYISPWLGTQQLSPARVEDADRWSVVRNDQYIVLTHESGYYGRDMGQIGKREAADAMAGLIRYLRRAEDEPPSNPAEWHTVAESKLELAKWEEKLERCNEAISAFKSTVYRFALDLSWGEVVS